MQRALIFNARLSLGAAVRRGASAKSGNLTGWRSAGLSCRWMSSLPDHSTITMPALSPTMTEGVIAEWVTEVGDEVTAGQPVCSIETDKATVDFEVQDDGFLARILAPAGGGAMPVGAVIGVIVENKEDVAAFSSVTAAELGAEDAPAAAAPAAEPAPEPIATTPAAAATPAAAPAAAQVAVSASGGRIFISPLAKKIALENNIDIASIPGGSGPKGRIIRLDVDAFLASGGAAQAAAGAGAVAAAPVAAQSGDYFDTPVTSDAQALASQLEKSKRDIPHYYLNSEIEISALLALRDQLNTTLPEGEQVSVNDFIIRAAALCMARVPDVNASWGGTFIRNYKGVDINVAMINEEEDALLMPVIRGAHAKGLAAIAGESRKMVSGDAESSDELDLGVGTFTISNLGAFGLKTFTPIVREPQACSLGVGTISRRAVPGEADAEGNPTVQVVTNLTVTMSCDHRVVDGAVGAKWLQEFKQLLQNPISMLL